MDKKTTHKTVAKTYFYDGAYLDNVEKVKQSNLHFYKLFDMIMIVLLIMLYISTYFSSYAVTLMPVYVAFIAISVAEMLFIHFVLEKSSKYTMPACYFGIIKAYVFCMCVSVFFNKEAPAVTYLVFLILIPIVFLLKPAVMITIQFLATALFCAATILLKPELVARDDIFNAILFCGMGMLMAHEIGSLRINNISMASDALKHSKELEENRNILNEALKNARMAVWKYNSAQKNVEYSYTDNIDDHAAFLGSVPETMIKMGVVHPSSTDEIRKIFANADNGAMTSGGDVLLKARTSNNYIWTHISLVKSADDGIYLGTATDITEQKNNEEQYEKQMLALEGVCDDNLITKGRWNLTLNKKEYVVENGKDTIHFNEMATYDEAASALTKDIVPPAKQKEVIELLDRKNLIDEYSKGKDAFTIEYQRKVDKNIIWVSTQIHLCAVPGKNELMLFASGTDISESIFNKMVLDRLLDEEYDYFGTIVKDTGVSTIRGTRKDFRAVIKDISKKETTDSYDVSLKNVLETYIGKPESEQYFERMKLSNVIEQLDKTGNYFVTFFLKDRDVLRRKKMQFKYIDNTHDTILFTRTDITDVYMAEQQQLQAVRDSLAQVEKANSAKSTFLSRMSHDMRTPMNGIIGMTKLTQDIKDLPQEAVENLDAIESSSKFLLSLINDTLDMNRIESNHIQLNKEVVCSSDIFKTVLNSITPLTNEKKIDFKYVPINIHDDYIYTDKLRAQQVVLNILSNAVKFTPENGKITLEAECLSREDNIDYCRISVEDNGPGMSKEFISHIYEPFSQENSNETGLVGTGLGMSIVKSLVELMGGTIQVESAQGKGTKVTVFVGFERADKQQHNKNEKVANVNIKGKRVLLAEDHPLNATIAKRLLAKEGVVTECADNGQIATDMFEKSPEGYYDAVLMDIRMPVMDGIEATKTMRAMQRSDAKTIPIIAMTANAFDTDRIATKNAGMNAHLAKPISPEELYETLSEKIAENK